MDIVCMCFGLIVVPTKIFFWPKPILEKYMEPLGCRDNVIMDYGLGI